RPVVLASWGRGEALRLAGDPEAEQVLREAARVAGAHGMVPLVRRCERSLRALGVRLAPGVGAPGAVPAVAAVLSPREVEVAGLVREGLTDREIAARLGLAHRTVQTQVASARRKLGAESRAHLAAL